VPKVVLGAQCDKEHLNFIEKHPSHIWLFATHEFKDQLDKAIFLLLTALNGD